MKPPRDLPAEIAAALTDGSLQSALPKALRHTIAARRRAVEEFPGFEAARDRARAIKEDAIERLPELIETLHAAVEAGGGRLHRAADADEACAIITGIATRAGARRVVKSKSMTSEEIHLNAALEAAGLQVRETDLGEYIVQLDDDRPSHIIAPIIHKGLEDVRETFRRAFPDREIPATAEELTQLARELLRADFLAADLGITGANFVIADSGTVVIVENEGNARLSTQLPRVHVALAGIEKIIPAMEDLEPFLQLLPRSGTGQLMTTYLSIISGPGWGSSPLVEGEREFHLVLLDNGRMAMRDDPLLREALYCIRCGACLNVCPPYQVVGGHVFGGDTYQSGIGNAWEAGVRGLDAALEFNGLCTTCSRCREVCPVRIDIPWLNAGLRDRGHDGASPGRLDAMMLEPERLYAALRRAGRLSAIADTGIVRGLMERALGIDPRRPMVEVAPRTLLEEHRARGGTIVDGPPPPDLPADTVLFWADCHTDHVDVEAGLAAIELLGMLGYDVRLVAGPCCGRAAVSQGRLPEARDMSHALIARLEPWIAAGAEVVGLEPSCVTCITDDAARLLGEDSPALLVGTATKEVMRFVEDNVDRLEELLMAEQLERDLRGDPEIEGAPSPRRLVVHGHCQQKSAGWFPATLAVLERLPGVRAVPTRAECCGMAGSWGYKTDWYPISRELGYRLLAEIDEIESVDGPADEVMACGTSCRAQLGDFGGRRPRHPVQLVAELVREARDRAARERSGG